MLRNLKTIATVNQRTYKNFGHKRQPVPIFTTLWHGFLTFTFIGLVIKWDKVRNFIFGGEDIKPPETLTESINYRKKSIAHTD